MACTYRADRGIGCTISVWDGYLTCDELVHQMIRVANDPDWPAGPRHIIDCTTLKTFVAPDSDDLGVLYEGTGLIEEMRIAILMPPGSPETTFLYPAGDDELFTAVPFTTLEGACAHVDVNASAVRTIIAELRHDLSRVQAG